MEHLNYNITINNYKYNQNKNNMHLITIYMQRKIIKYRNMQYLQIKN